MTLPEALQFQMPIDYKNSPKFNTLSKTINLLASELGDVIKDQAGVKYFRIVEDLSLIHISEPTRPY